MNRCFPGQEHDPVDKGADCIENRKKSHLESEAHLRGTIMAVLAVGQDTCLSLTSFTLMAHDNRNRN